MVSARVTVIDRTTATRRQRNARWLRDGDGRLVVVVDDIEIEEEEIAREYDEGALPLVTMPLLLHAHLLVQGQGFRRRQFQQERTTRDDTTTSWRNETTRGRIDETMRRREGGASRRDATTSRRDERKRVRRSERTRRGDATTS